MKNIILEEFYRKKLAKCIFSSIFALIFLFSRCSVIDDVWSSAAENYMKLPTAIDFISTIIFFVICYTVLTLLQYFYEKRLSSGNSTADFKGIKVFALSLLIFGITWIPYILAFYPGTVYSDTISNYGQAAGLAGLNNHHPILYIFIIKFCMMLTPGGGYTSVAYCYTIIQVIFMIVVLAYFVFWLSEHGIERKGIIILMIVIALFPYYPMYAITAWKDTYFSLVLLLFTLSVFDIVLSEGRAMSQLKTMMGYLVWGLMVVFLRNNGFYILVCTTLILAVWKCKTLLRCYKRFFAFSLGIIILSKIILGPVYDSLGYNVDGAVESLGIPLQQIAAVIAKDESISADEKEYLEQICPIENWKTLYYPCCVDRLKWDPSFNAQVLENDMTKFLKVWAKMLPKHFGTYVESYLLATNSYWNVNKSLEVAHILTIIWVKDAGIQSHDYLMEMTGFDLKGGIDEMPKIPEGCFLFLFIVGNALLFITNKQNRIIGYAPIIIALLTIFVAVPVASSLRYVYYLVLTLPLTFTAPLLRKKEKDSAISSPQLPSASSHNSTP